MTESNIRPAPINIRKANRADQDWLYIYLRSNVTERTETDEVGGEEYTIYEYDEQHVRIPLPDGIEVDVPTDHSVNQDALKAQLKDLFASNADFRTALQDALTDAQLVDWRDRVSDWGGEPAVSITTEENWQYWVPGEAVGVGDQRYYGDALYECIQAHTTAGHWNPELTTPTLWVVIPEGDEWVAGAQYEVGDIVTYNNNEYECIQAHTSQAGWEPPNVPALWSLVAEPTDEWQAGVSYSVGDVVLYGGAEYECRQAHTALVGWEPPNVPALWLAL